MCNLIGTGIGKAPDLLAVDGLVRRGANDALLGMQAAIGVAAEKEQPASLEGGKSQLATAGG